MNFPCEVSADHLGIYVTKDTGAAMKPPCVNAQLAAALLMRAMSGKTEGARESAMGQLTVLSLGRKILVVVVEQENVLCK